MSVRGHNVEECLSRRWSAIESKTIGIDDGLLLERQRGRHGCELEKVVLAKNLSVVLEWRRSRRVSDGPMLKAGKSVPTKVSELDQCKFV